MIALLVKQILGLGNDTKSIPKVVPIDTPGAVPLSKEDQSHLRRVGQTVRRLSEIKLNKALISLMLLGVDAERIRERFNFQEINLSPYVFFAVKCRHAEMLITLKELGAKLDTRDKYGDALVHIAALRRSLNILRVLKKLGTNLKALLHKSPKS